MQTYLITGGAQGIGQVIVEKLLSANNALIVIDKQRTKFIESCVSNEHFTFYHQDIADREGLAKVLAKISKTELDGIVNNAGEVYLEKWDELSLDTWDRTLAVNLTAPLQIVHELRNALKRNAAVVNIASVDGTCAAFDTFAYAASKAGLMNLTKSMAAVMGSRGVRVNAVAPGWVETEMTKDTMPAESADLTPLGRNAKPSDVSNVVEFLLSESAGFIDGETITVDGGLTIIDFTLFKEAGR
jgi:3-oxoacyl-[acyl-carrier protein] reductase